MKSKSVEDLKDDLDNLIGISESQQKKNIVTSSQYKTQIFGFLQWRSEVTAFMEGVNISAAQLANYKSLVLNFDPNNTSTASLERRISDYKNSLYDESFFLKSLNLKSLKSKDDQGMNNNVFIVHGHDKIVKLDVARFVETLGLKSIILHEQPNMGRPILSKLEHYGNQADFAIVLMTADDLGKLKSDSKKSKYKYRARQNVILELGYFIGILGGGKVCVLVEEGIEIPSDYYGVVPIYLDSPNWQIELIKELKEADLPVTLP